MRYTLCCLLMLCELSSEVIEDTWFVVLHKLQVLYFVYCNNYGGPLIWLNDYIMSVILSSFVFLVLIWACVIFTLLSWAGWWSTGPQTGKWRFDRSDTEWCIGKFFIYLHCSVISKSWYFTKKRLIFVCLHILCKISTRVIENTWFAELHRSAGCIFCVNKCFVLL